MRGKFITLEGPEGSGKSTQAEQLAAFLKSRGIEAVCTREPGGTALGEAVRNLLQHNEAGEAPCERAELFLFQACRSQLTERVIRPNLERGNWVICDRFMDSTTAYQGYARGLPLDEIIRLHRFAVQDAVPDLTLLLDLPVTKGLERIAKRRLPPGVSADRFEAEDRAFHERVRSGYLELAKQEPDRFRMIDADRDPGSVAEAIRQAVEEKMNLPAEDKNR